MNGLGASYMQVKLE